MKKSIKNLLLVFLLTLFSYYFICLVAKPSLCVPDCKNKKCGEFDGCLKKCKSCSQGYICDNNVCVKSSSEKIKKNGICFFDIDDTLTSSSDSIDDIVDECVKNNFEVGIVTASYRDIDHVCNPEKNNNFYSKKLCEQLKKNNYKTFNSLLVTAGNKKIPKKIKLEIDNQNYGLVKALQIEYSKTILNENINDKNVIFFDDQLAILNSVKNYNKNFKVICANKFCGGKYLDVDLIKKSINI